MSVMVGRPEKPLDFTVNPDAAALAQQLRELRRRAGAPTYRAMAAAVHYSAPALSLAANGRRLPTWACTRAYVLACGVRRDDLEHWWQLWRAARQDRRLARTPQPDQRRPWTPSWPAPDGADLDTDRVDERTQSLVVTVRELETDPYSIADMTEFRGALNQLREACRLSLREVERRSAAVAQPGTGEQIRLTRSHLNDMLAGHTQLQPQHVHLFLTVCGMADDDRRRWLRVFTRLRTEQDRVRAAKRALQTLVDGETSDPAITEPVTSDAAITTAPGPVDRGVDRVVDRMVSAMEPSAELVEVVGRAYRGHHRNRFGVIRGLRRILGW